MIEDAKRKRPSVPLVTNMAHALICVVLAAGCRANVASNVTDARESDQAVPVEVVEVKATDFVETVNAIGTLAAIQRVEIRPELDGIIKEVHFSEGATVEQGQLLFVLDDSKLQRQVRERQQALEAAQATLEFARREFKRNDQLLNDGAVARDVWDQAWQQQRTAAEAVQRLEAAVAFVQEQLDDTEIRAPLDAVAAESRVDPGDYASVADLLVTLYQQAPIEVVFWVPEQYAGRITTEGSAEVRVDAFPERTFSAKISFLGPRVDAQTRRLRVKAIVDNPEKLLKPGSFADVTVTLDVREGRPSVPEESLVATRKGYRVFVVGDGKAEQRSVQVGLRQVGTAEILEGVDVGERVVVSGHERLSSGDPVKNVDPKGADARDNAS